VRPLNAESGPVEGIVPEVRNCVSKVLFVPPPNETVV